METRQAALNEYAGNSPETDAKSAGIYRLVVGGVRPSQAARSLKIPKSTVYDLVAKWLKQGRITRVSVWPALYAEASETTFRKMPCEVHKPAFGLFAPHRLGVTFFIKRKALGYQGFTSSSVFKGGTVFRWLEGDFTVEAYPSKVKVWGMRLRGGRSEEALRRGLLSIRERALAWCGEQGVSLTLDRVLTPVEWTIADKALSDYARKAFELDVAPIKVGGAELCVDRSHPNNVEIRGEEAGEVVRRFDELLRLAPEIAAAAQGYRTINQALMQQANLITQNTAILQGLYELLEKRRGNNP